ncbi:hypothetical protein Anapl_18729 [Anas platyrhynchos]|uniref:Uncharacterized protein n=1 Tax=Anas platyrhynchos TaxID=8839 RepID=R0KZM7_ANAPL|nr:hypothetical protein Anapl_18729 [Anas platyrhynchos]
MSVKEGGKTIHKPSCIINHEALRYCIYTGTDGVTVLVLHLTGKVLGALRQDQGAAPAPRCGRSAPAGAPAVSVKPTCRCPPLRLSYFEREEGGDQEWALESQANVKGKKNPNRKNDRFSPPRRQNKVHSLPPNAAQNHSCLCTDFSHLESKAVLKGSRICDCGKMYFIVGTEVEKGKYELLAIAAGNYWLKEKVRNKL